MSAGVLFSNLVWPTLDQLYVPSIRFSLSRWSLSALQANPVLHPSQRYGTESPSPAQSVLASAAPAWHKWTYATPCEQHPAWNLHVQQELRQLPMVSLTRKYLISQRWAANWLIRWLMKNLARNVEVFNNSFNTKRDNEFCAATIDKAKSQALFPKH